jgi:hypothetical protein
VRWKASQNVVLAQLVSYRHQAGMIGIMIVNVPFPARAGLLGGRAKSDSSVSRTRSISQV